MTTYVYKTIPERADEQSAYFEIKQCMQDAALRRHPETGRPVRRVILGGIGVLKKSDASAEANEGCGPGCCCNGQD